MGERGVSYEKKSEAVEKWLNPYWAIASAAQQSFP